jgi:hypothetical protein
LNNPPEKKSFIYMIINLKYHKTMKKVFFIALMAVLGTVTVNLFTSCSKGDEDDSDASEYLEFKGEITDGKFDAESTSIGTIGLICIEYYKYKFKIN